MTTTCLSSYFKIYLVEIKFILKIKTIFILYIKMSDFMNLYFGPLSVESCIYFKVLTMFFFALFVFAIISEIVFVIKRYQTLNFRIFTNIYFVGMRRIPGADFKVIIDIFYNNFIKYIYITYNSTIRFS